MCADYIFSNRVVNLSCLFESKSRILLVMSEYDHKWPTGVRIVPYVRIVPNLFMVPAHFQIGR